MFIIKSNIESTTRKPTAGLASSSTPSSTQGNDSGYVSAAGTPDNRSLEGDNDSIERSTGTLFRRRTTKLKIFNNEIPSHVQDRFHDLIELFEKPLYEHLTKNGSTFSAISIKLKMLGDAEATAKPFIFVQCNEVASKRVKQFFKRSEVKAELHPRNSDISVPSYDFIVSSRPPRPLAMSTMTSVHQFNKYDSVTLCGETIKTDICNKTHLATIGGIVKITTPEHGVAFYAMTAGHINALGPQSVDAADQRVRFDQEYHEYSEDEETFSDSVEFELDMGFEGQSKDDEKVHNVPLSQTAAQCPQKEDPWTELGHISTISSQSHRDKRNLDWALVEIGDPLLCKPNLFVLADKQSHFIIGNELRELDRRTMKTDNGQPVVIVSSISGVQFGRFSSSSSFLMMGSSSAFTETYTLALNDESALKPGDCGSWVIDDTTHEVYGHVVASDMLGEIYIVPLKATLQHIEEQLDAKSVCLPTQKEIDEWREQRCETVKPSLSHISSLSTSGLSANDAVKASAQPRRLETKEDGFRNTPKPQSGTAAPLNDNQKNVETSATTEFTPEPKMRTTPRKSKDDTIAYNTIPIQDRDPLYSASADGKHTHVSGEFIPYTPRSPGNVSQPGINADSVSLIAPFPKHYRQRSPGRDSGYSSQVSSARSSTGTVLMPNHSSDTYKYEERSRRLSPPSTYSVSYSDPQDLSRGRRRVSPFTADSTVFYNEEERNWRPSPFSNSHGPSLRARRRGSDNGYKSDGRAGSPHGSGNSY